MEKNEVSDLRTKIIKGLDLTYKRLIEFKKNKNSPIIIEKDGKIIELSAEDLPPANS